MTSEYKAVEFLVASEEESKGVQSTNEQSRTSKWCQEMTLEELNECIKVPEAIFKIPVQRLSAVPCSL